ncbi:T cell receptor gamma constant 1 isoform X4 [Macaca fascicularis]|uniref:T cell receptor gamma constant 1 isoform X4 n=1 Tax=Macaca fascicularis TaxID=9541 RepID=UPI003D15DF01
MKTNNTYMKFSWLTVPEKSLDKEHRCIVRHENNRNGVDQEIIFPPIKTDVTTVDPKDSFSKDANDDTTVDPKDNYSEDANVESDSKKLQSQGPETKRTWALQSEISLQLF